MSEQQKYYMLLTKAGEAAMTRAQVEGRHVRFSHLALGDANHATDFVPDRNQAALIHEVYRAEINKKFIRESLPNCLHLQAQIPAQAGGFWVREIGVIGEDNQLLAIGNYPASYKPAVGEGGLIRELTITAILETSGIAPPEVLNIQMETVERDEMRQIAQNLIETHNQTPDPHPQYLTEQEGREIAQEITNRAVGAIPELRIGEGLTETLADNVRGVALASTQAENIGWKNGLHYDKFGRVTQIAHVNAGLNDGCRRVKIIPDAQYQILRDDFGAALILENKTGKSGNVTSQKYCEFKMPATDALVAGDSVFIVNNSGLPIYLVAQNGNIIANQTSQKSSGFLIDANYNIKALWDGTQLNVMTELRHTPRKPAPSTDYFLTNTKESARWHTEELEFHHLGRIVLFQAQLNTHYASFYIPQNIFNGHLPLLMLYSVVAWGSVHSPDLQNVYMFFKPKNLGDDVKPNDWIFNKAGNRVRYEAIVLGQGSDDTDQGRGLTGMAGKVLWEYQDRQDFCISGNFKAVVTVMATGCYYAKSQKSPIISETVWTGSKDVVVVEEPPPTRTT